MDGKARDSHQPLSCEACREDLQEYLDGTLDKNRSLRVFLHLRDCRDCAAEHESLQVLFTALDSLPDMPVPEKFDETVLASVPYTAYKAMASLRAERVPVFLEEEFLPAFVRAPVVRWSGGLLALAGVLTHWLADGPQSLVALAVVGLLPEVLVRLQSLGRWATLTVRRSES